MTAPVSVIVAVRNAEGSIGLLIDALAAQDPRPEILVVDDASTDRTRAVAEGRGTARVLGTERWSGAYAARNLALAETSAPVVAFTDADCRPGPSWLRVALEDLEALGADVLAGHVEVPLSKRPGLVELVDFSRYLDQERAVREAGFGATANLIVRRAVLDRLGGFRAEGISDGDRDLCRRATAAGFTLAYSPRAAVVHEPRRRPYDLARRGFRDGVGRAEMRARTPDAPMELPSIWRRPGAWFPSALLGRGEVYGIERLAAVGRPPGWARRRAMGLVEWALVQLPMVSGSLLGELREAIRR